MRIRASGSGSHAHFYDTETGLKYGSYCPCCDESLRSPSNRWSWHLYRHTLSAKHARAEAFYNEAIMGLWTEERIGEARAHATTPGKYSRQYR